MICYDKERGRKHREETPGGNCKKRVMIFNLTAQSRKLSLPAMKIACDGLKVYRECVEYRDILAPWLILDGLEEIKPVNYEPRPEAGRVAVDSNIHTQKRM